MYRSPIIVRMIKYRRFGWASHIVIMEVDLTAFKTVSGNPKGKRPLGRPRSR